jgi:WD40 repeat protein
VYAIAFNNPFGDKVVTGSFDKTAKLWDAYTGEELACLRGHTAEIVCVAFNPAGTVVATGGLLRVLLPGAVPCTVPSTVKPIAFGGHWAWWCVISRALHWHGAPCALAGYRLHA